MSLTTNRWTPYLGALLVIQCVAHRVPLAGWTQAQEAGSSRLYCLMVPVDTPGPSAVLYLELDGAGGVLPKGSFPTGGLGGQFSSEQDLEIDPRERFLVASNNESNDLTVYSIGEDGSLTAVQGSPFPAGDGPLRVAFHPGLDVMYVTHWKDATLRSFRIAGDGSLSAMDVLNSGAPRDVEVRPGGRFLYVADMSGGVLGYGITDTGSPSEVPGLPLRFSSSRPVELEISSDGRRLWVLDLDKGLSAFDIDDSGGLSLVPGSPVVVGEFMNLLEATGDDRFAYVGMFFETGIGGLDLQEAGPPRLLPGSPFGAPGEVLSLVISRDGTRLHHVTRRLQSYEIAESGRLTPIRTPVFLSDPAFRIPNAACLGTGPRGVRFVRGDANSDGVTDLTDPISTLEFLFRGGARVACEDAADSNDDGVLDLTDGIFVLDHLFRGGGPLPAPAADGCGTDPGVADALGCEEGC